MPKVFISFVHEEQAYAVRNMFGSGRDGIFSSDSFQVCAAGNWLGRIMTELEGAPVVVLMLSPRSVKRAWVNFEARLAWTRKIIIVIAVCFSGMKIDALPKPYSNLQALI